MEWADDVYDYIWNYVTEHEALPSRQMIADTLGIDPRTVTAAIEILRRQGRVEGRYILPTAYHDWWKEHVRARWSYRALRSS